MQYLAFTFHKAGSMALHDHLGWLAAATGLPHHSANYANAEAPGRHAFTDIAKVNDPDWWRDAGAGRDGILGPLRRPVLLPEALSAPGVICVRDPRDALTSMFFSFTFSHVGIPDDQRARRSRMGIDKFALRRAPDLKARLVAYRAMLAQHPGWRVLRYEDMVLRFDTWMNELVGAFGLAPDSAALDAYVSANLAQNARIIADRQVQERVESHIRSVTPGDHLRKLAPETITAIDTLMADELQFFGYAR